jgi:hypothetical protein
MKLRQGLAMSECGERASLIVTRSVEGTATNIARRRVELRCGLTAGHEGPHRDPAHGEEWAAEPGQRPALLRHEDEEALG